jgi:hypothetical protein
MPTVCNLAGRMSRNNRMWSVLQEQWFECSKCTIWAHVRCVYPDLTEKAAEDLPQSLLCHRCIIDAAGGKPRVLSSGGLGKRSGTASKSAMRSSPSKRKKAAVHTKKQSAKVSVSATMLSPSKKTKAYEPGAVTPTRTTKGRAAARKYLTTKGSTIRFEDTEVRHHFRLIATKRWVRPGI